MTGRSYRSHGVYGGDGARQAAGLRASGRILKQHMKWTHVVLYFQRCYNRAYV